MTDRFELAGIMKEIKEQKPFHENAAKELESICSFCHNRESEVELMIIAAASAVCSECITLHARILREYRETEQRPETTQPGAHESEG